MGRGGASKPLVTTACSMAAPANLPPNGCAGGTLRNSSVLDQPEDVAVGIGEGGHRGGPHRRRVGLLTVAPAAVTSASFASMSGTCQWAHRRGHALRCAARHQPDLLTSSLEADVVRSESVCGWTPSRAAYTSLAVARSETDAARS